MQYINIIVYYTNGLIDNMQVKSFTYIDDKIYFFESNDNDFWLSPDEIEKIEIL